MIRIDKNDVHSEIVLKELEKDEWYEVEKDITFSIFGGNLVVPKGFKTDLASIPPKLQGIVPKRGLYDAGSILHDYLYSEFSEYNINRQDSDIIFYSVIKSCGVDNRLANKFYSAVRLCGENHYKKCKLNGNVPPERVAIVDKRTSYVKYKENLEKLLPRYKTLYL